MSDLAVIAGLPVKVMVGGVEYLVSPMTLGDWAELERWAQGQFYTDMKKRMELVEDDDVRKIIQTRLATISYTEVMKVSKEYMDDGEGTAFRLCLMLKNNHEDITLEKAKTLIGFREFARVQRMLLGLTPEPTKEELEEAAKEAEEAVKGRPIES